LLKRPRYNRALFNRGRSLVIPSLAL